MTLGAEGLRELLEEMKTAPEVYRASAFWDELGAVGTKQLESSGFENFKRTVNMAYFNWGVLGIARHQLLPLVAQSFRRSPRHLLEARFPNARSTAPGVGRSHAVSNFRVPVPDMASFGPVSAFIYRTYVAMLWDYVAQSDPKGLLCSLDEPSYGNPFVIEYRGRRTSQDLCNSVHELYSATEGFPDGGPRDIAELGGGYGRLAYVFLNAIPGSSYCLVDIPPALNVAQEYLTRVFPSERIFHFRPFDKFEDVREEFESARIRFLAAHQIEKLPPKIFDLFLNISSLHEMTLAQIQNYLIQIDRVCRGRFYTKQWRESKTTVNGMVIREDEYPIPVAWRQIFHRRHPIQRLFFEALYELPRG